MGSIHRANVNEPAEALFAIQIYPELASNCLADCPKTIGNSGIRAPYMV